LAIILPGAMVHRNGKEARYHSPGQTPPTKRTRTACVRSLAERLACPEAAARDGVRSRRRPVWFLPDRESNMNSGVLDYRAQRVPARPGGQAISYAPLQPAPWAAARVRKARSLAKWRATPRAKRMTENRTEKFLGGLASWREKRDGGDLSQRRKGAKWWGKII